MSQAHQKLKQYEIIECYAFKQFNLVQKIEKFINECLNNNNSLQTNHKQLTQMTMQILKLIDKELSSDVQKIWARLIFVELLMTFGTDGVLNQQFVDFLNESCEELNAQLNQCTSGLDQSIMMKVSRSFMKIKSMISLSVGNEDDEKSRGFEKEIVQLLLLRARKKLQDWAFWKDIKSIAPQSEQSQQPSDQPNNEPLETFRQRVWKIINLFKTHQKICNLYKKAQTVQSPIQPLMMATFYIFGSNSLKTYPLITKLIETQSQIIKAKYDLLVKKNLEKKILMKKLDELSKEEIFVEFSNLLKELTAINETMIYIFVGRHHKQNMTIKIPKGLFLNTANPKLDDIHKIIKAVDQAKEKRLRARNNLSRISIQLDSSVSSVIQRFDQTHSIATDQYRNKRLKSTKFQHEDQTQKINAKYGSDKVIGQNNQQNQQSKSQKFKPFGERQYQQATQIV